MSIIIKTSNELRLAKVNILNRKRHEKIILFLTNEPHTNSSSILDFNVNDLTGLVHFAFLLGYDCRVLYTRDETETNTELYDKLCNIVFDIARETNTSFKAVSIEAYY